MRGYRKLYESLPKEKEVMENFKNILIELIDVLQVFCILEQR